VGRNTRGAARAPVAATLEREPAGEARQQPAAGAGGAIDGPGRFGRAGHPLVVDAPAADRVRGRVGVIEEQIDAGVGRDVSAAGCADDGRALAASPGIRRGRARSPPPGWGRAAARAGTRARTTGQVVPGRPDSTAIPDYRSKLQHRGKPCPPTGN
jgi:hypothetical protein